MSQVHGPFAKLDEAALRELAPGGAVRSFPKGAVLVNEGDATDSLYVLLSGRVKVFVSDEEGAELVLNTIDAGDYFGELVLDGGTRSASVMALEPCHIFVIPRGDVEGLLEHNPAFARDLVRKLIGKVRSLTNKVLDLALKDVYGRFVRFIDEHVVEQDGIRLVPERLTQHDIAVRIGGSREMVSRIIKELAAGGYISIESKRVIVHKKLPAKW
jgi:CRP/FNR family transcriptional regulator, cyclic AMP receptor protein